MSLLELEKLLKDKNPKVRFEAVREVVDLGTPQAGKLLVKILKDETHDKVRDRIQKGIQFLKQKLARKSEPSEEEDEEPPKPKPVSPQTLESVREALNSGEPDKEKKAMGFMVKNQCVQLLQPLLELALERDEPGYAIQALQAVKALGVQAVADDVMEFLKNSRPKVVESAVDCLKGLKALGFAIDHFKSMCNDENEAISTIGLNALQELGDSGDRAASDFLVEVRARKEELARRAKVSMYIPDGMDDLLPKRRDQAEEEKKKKDAVRKQAAVKLFRFKELLESNNPKDRISAVEKLAAADDPEAIELIVQLLATEKVLTVLTAGLQALGKLGKETAVASMQTYLAHDIGAVRAAAIEGICDILGPERPKPMIERFLTDPDPAVKAQAVAGLYFIKPTECFLPLSALINSKDEKLNLLGIQVIGKIRDETVVGMVRRFLHEDNAVLKSMVQSMLAQWAKTSEVARFLVNQPDGDFKAFMSDFNERKRIEQLKAEQEGSKKGGKVSGSEDDDSVGGFLSGLMGKLSGR